MSAQQIQNTSTAWQKLRTSRSSTLSVYFIGLLLLVALAGDFIANDKPIYCKVLGQKYYPVFNEYAHQLGFSDRQHPDLGTDWHDLTYEQSLWPLIPFSGSSLDLENAYQAPFTGAKKNNRFKHILGTGILGKDMAAGIVEGTRVALIVGIFSMLLAVFIGLLVGSIAGYFGDNYFHLSWLSIIFMLLGLLLGGFYTHLFYQLWAVSSSGLFMTLLLFAGSLGIGIFTFALFLFLGLFLDKLFSIPCKQTIPMDILLMRMVEIVNSLPALLVLMVLAGMFEVRSIWIVVFIIAFIKWTGIAKFVRAELLQIRSMDYVRAAKSAGSDDWSILWNHALPNALTPVYITIAFGIAGAILLESTISFLGIGISQEIMSWGKMLAQARQKPSAWWLAVFPGLMIFLCVVAFNIIGDKLRTIYKQ